MRRITTMVLVSAPILAVLAGCSAGGGTTTAPTPTPAGSAPDATSSIGAPATSATPSRRTPTAPASESTDDSGQGGGGTPRCLTRDLKVSVASDPGGGAAGSTYESLIFTNAAGHACTLFGYPGVSFVAGDRGAQVNNGFTRDAAAGRPTVRLLPGKRAHATIRIVNWQNLPDDVCKPVPVRGLRVYPPDESAAVFVSRPQKACSAKGQGVGSVSAITLTTG